MSLPVSQYEALLAEVRGLRRKAQRVQQLATPLLSNAASNTKRLQNVQNTSVTSSQSYLLDYKMDSVDLERQECDINVSSDLECNPVYNENECNGRTHSTQVSVSSEPISHENRDVSLLYHGTWPVERTMWNSEPLNLGPSGSCCNRMDTASVMSFAYSSGGAQLDRVLNNADKTKRSSQQLDAKVDMVYSLLSMLGGQEHADMGATLLALSTNPESCLAMRQSGCIPLLVQLVQSDRDAETRKKAAEALNNLIHSNPDEKLKKRETRVLKLLDQIRTYVAYLHNQLDVDFEISSPTEDGDKHPVQMVAHLMKLSFDETHRQAICQLGGIHTIANLVQSEHKYHGSTMDEGPCVLLRRYSCMALTNLTFGDSGNKALLCSFKEFMCALVTQLQSPCDELRQVTASVLRNLSWRADSTSKETLREVGTVTGLMKAAMLNNRENTLKSILSALWNLSAHCTENKSEICEVEGALGFLVDMLSYKTPSKSLVIIENAGGILRNISSQIAVREDFRAVLRQHNCLQILLEQLKSPSLTIVSNACGTLWNLSAKNQIDQETLWQIGAPAMLRSLNHSKHKMIAMGSSAALKNLLGSRPTYNLTPQMDATAQAMDLPTLPTLGARKQKALLQELEQNLSETFDNIDKDSPTKTAPENSGNRFTQRVFNKDKQTLQSGSQECITHTENNVYETCTSQSDSGILNDSFINRFSNLNVKEPLNTYQNRTGTSYENTSLPYLKPSMSYVPGQKYTSCSYQEESETADQPIDYSRKYLETKMTKTYNSASCSNDKKNFAYSSPAPKVVEDETFGIYTETDLDQPTDYSLRYAEDDLDSEECNKIEKTESVDFVQDTVKTYCTEDTPYETPFNYSTATSLSDLRDPNLDSEKQKAVIDNNKAITSDVKSRNQEKLSQSDEKDRCSVEDISESNNITKVPDKPIKSEFSSGLTSPEKPFGYAEEGTPGYFSRVSSFGSLSSVPLGEKTACETNVKGRGDSGEVTVATSEQKPNVQSEGKAVKFEQMVNYAEETPLMFSRSSSLASLDSIEQHSIHEDRESVISDFSRLTSGLVSPSELPDSPTQTVPPSPQLRKAPMEFSVANRHPVASFSNNSVARSTLRTTPKTSVFEDNITKFKEESTPLHFSTTTSLSSLTIDEHEDAMITKNDTKGMATIAESSKVVAKEEAPQGNHADLKKLEDNAKLDDVNDDVLNMSESEEDEDILAACINDGMQNNRHRLSDNNHTKLLPSATYKYQPKSILRPSGIPLPRTGVRKPAGAASSSPVRIPDNNFHSDSVHNYCTEDTPAMLSHANSNSDLSMLTTTTDNNPKREEQNYLSDDSSNLSGDNENILAECIQSAMPKVRKFDKCSQNKQMSGLPVRNIQTSSPIKPFLRMNQGCSSSFESKQKISQSSHIDSNFKLETDCATATDLRFSGRPDFDAATKSDTANGLWLSPNKSHASLPNAYGFPELRDQTNSSSGLLQSGNMNLCDEKPPTLSRQNSLSSLSADSLASLEQEQALLEQCISSGMPKSKHTSTPNKSLDLNIPHNVAIKPVGVATKQFNTSKHQSSFEARYDCDDKSNLDSKENRSMLLTHEHKAANSKNVNVTSVAKNTILEPNSVNPTIPAMATDVEPIGMLEKELNINHIHEVQADTLQDKRILTKENFSMQLMKNGFDIESGDALKESYSDECDGLSSSKRNREFGFENINLDAMTTTTVDTRMLDPDAMIESLDRFTAELVSQAEAAHSNKDGRKLLSSTNDVDTWNEDISNDITFPTISGSAPNVITFDSENKDEDLKLDIKNEDLIEPTVLIDHEQKSNDFSSLNTSTMTESTIIAAEATKIAAALNEVDIVQSITSITSLELDNIQPPSHMNSLTNSTNGLEQQSIRDSPKLVRRKRSLQSGLLARRALSNSLNQASSLESLDNHSLSNLDHMNPPSAMGEVLDMIDLEGSMISVASLTSEVFDSKPDNSSSMIKDEDHEPNPIFNIKRPSGVLASLSNNFMSDLENINPPSLFNEITDMCNSLADITTEVIGSETEAFEDCNTHFAETTLQTEDDLTHFSDAQSITPIQSDLSSNSPEASPKRVKSLNKRLTPKQKRKLVQERYRTYTVAAEMVVSEEFNSLIDNSKTENGFSEYHTLNESNGSSPNVEGSGSGKSTPKERRRNDRARFQTQVLDVAVTSALKKMCNHSETSKIEKVFDNSLSQSNSQSPQQSPCKSKFNRKQNFLQKRLENQDRFRTRTLSESSLSPDTSNVSQTQSASSNNDLQNLVKKEANKVLRNLKETRLHSDELLDCETLSLISNEDDSEHNSGSSINYRTYTKNYNGINRYITRPEEVKNQDSSQNIEGKCDLQNSNNIDLKKPKIMKPVERKQNEDQESPKGIRGRRKPLYVKTDTTNTRITPRNNNVRPIRNITSNLVKNVTSTMKSGTNLKNVAPKQIKMNNRKLPVSQVQVRAIKPPSGYKVNNMRNNLANVNLRSDKTSKNLTPTSSNMNGLQYKHDSSRTNTNQPPSLERQGTFTKETDQPTKSHIPTSVASNLPVPKSTSRLTKAFSQPNSRTTTRTQNPTPVTKNIKSLGSGKSTSSDRSSKLKSASSGIFSRSSSADSRDSSFNKHQNIYNSSSSQNLKSESQAGSVKRSSLSNISCRSNSNSSITSSGSGSKKPITSKIASYWKTDIQKLSPRSDTRALDKIKRNTSESSPRSLIRSNTFETKDALPLNSQA